jgi:hypothetical protein
LEESHRFFGFGLGVWNPIGCFFFRPTKSFSCVADPIGNWPGMVSHGSGPSGNTPRRRIHPDRRRAAMSPRTHNTAINTNSAPR